MRNINEHEKALNLFYHDGIGYKRIAAELGTYIMHRMRKQALNECRQ